MRICLVCTFRLHRYNFSLSFYFSITYFLISTSFSLFLSLYLSPSRSTYLSAGLSANFTTFKIYFVMRMQSIILPMKVGVRNFERNWRTDIDYRKWWRIDYRKWWRINYKKWCRIDIDYMVTTLYKTANDLRYIYGSL